MNGCEESHDSQDVFTEASAIASHAKEPTQLVVLGTGKVIIAETLALLGQTPPKLLTNVCHARIAKLTFCQVENKGSGSKVLENIIQIGDEFRPALRKDGNWTG